MKNYTLPELAAKTDREWFSADEICSVLNTNPQTLRTTAGAAGLPVYRFR